MTAPKRPSRRRRSISGWLSPMGTALRTWAWTQGEEALVGGVTDSDHVLRNNCLRPRARRGERTWKAGALSYGWERWDGWWSRWAFLPNS